MFRPMRRAKKAIPDEAAKRLLQTERRGVLAVNGDLGYPYAVPVNFLYDEAAGKLYFHGARAGHKADALRLAAKYYPDAETIETELAHAGRAVQVFEITVEHLSGKQIQEK